MTFDFSKLGNLGALVGDAKKIQDRIKKVQEELAIQEFEVSSGGGLIIIRANGNQEILAIRIDKTLRDEGDFSLIQDLIVAAVNEALKRARERLEEEMAKVSGVNFSAIKNMLNI